MGGVLGEDFQKAGCSWSTLLRSCMKWAGFLRSKYIPPEKVWGALGISG